MAGSCGALGSAWSPRTPQHFCVAGVTLWRHGLAFGVAGVALGDFDFRFAWQAWRFWHMAGSCGALGSAWSPGTPRHFCVAGVALGDMDLRCAWQAWHFATATCVLRGRRSAWGQRPCFAWQGGFYGTGLDPETCYWSQTIIKSCLWTVITMKGPLLISQVINRGKISYKWR